MTVIRFRSVVLSHLHLLIHDVSDRFFFVVLFWSELIQVVKGGCVLLNQQWASGCAWKQAEHHVGAGYRLCGSAGTRLLQQLRRLPGYVSLADVSARLVHQAKLSLTPNICVYIYIKSDLLSLITSHTLKYSQHTQINMSDPQLFIGWSLFLGAVSVELWVCYWESRKKTKTAITVLLRSKYVMWYDVDHQYQEQKLA